VARYRFTTRWLLSQPIEKVWDTIYDAGRWPEWWHGVERVHELERGLEDSIGTLWCCTWKSVLPYRLTFDMRVTRVERPVALDGVARGDLTGEGRWRLFSGSQGTLVRYEWDVATTGVWMNLFAPIARPLFSWNHDVVMRSGGIGLARRLQAPAGR
jgi:uncharacterized protein YndB with AHSA1/START domain